MFVVSPSSVQSLELTGDTREHALMIRKILHKWQLWLQLVTVKYGAREHEKCHVRHWCTVLLINEVAGSMTFSMASPDSVMLLSCPHCVPALICGQ